MKKALFEYKKNVAALICRTGFLAFMKWIRLRLFNKPFTTILCYHRVSDKDMVLAPVRTSLNNFKKHVKLLAQYYNFISLQDLSAFLLKQQLPPPDTLIFTFDDGYQANLEAVSSILKDYNACGTFFVSSGPVLHKAPYWLDILGQELQKAIAGNGEFDNEFRNIFGENNLMSMRRDSFAVTWRLGKQLLQDYFRGQLGREAIESLTKIISSNPQLDNHERQTATLDQLLQLQKTGHTIGAHTVSHPRLSNLSQEACAAEINKSIQNLTLAGLKINSFAYPFGKLSDIGEHAPRILKNTKIAIAVTTEERPVGTKDDPLLLPRLAVANQTAELLACRIELSAWKMLFSF